MVGNVIKIPTGKDGESEDISIAIIHQRVQKIAEFARSVLPWSIPKLEKVNPSFSVLSKYCSFIAAVIKDEIDDDNENGAKIAHAEITEIMDVLASIAEAIIDRDDSTLVDCMAHLDEFFERCHDIECKK